MTTPIVFLVDGERTELEALTEALRRRFGDVRHGSVKRVATAVGEGAAAVQLVHEYLNDQAG